MGGGGRDDDGKYSLVTTSKLMGGEELVSPDYHISDSHYPVCSSDKLSSKG